MRATVTVRQEAPAPVEVATALAGATRPAVEAARLRAADRAATRRAVPADPLAAPAARVVSADRLAPEARVAAGALRATRAQPVPTTRHAFRSIRSLQNRAPSKKCGRS